MEYKNSGITEENCGNYLSSYSPKYLTALFGSDTGDSLSPLIHNKMYEKLNIPAVYKAFSICRDDFREAFRAVRMLEFKGINITYPFKEKAISLVDELEESGEKIGAINTVEIEGSTVRGYNTDYIALKKLFKNWFAGKNMQPKILLVGAGGAARAVAAAIEYSQFLAPRRVLIANRTVDRARNLATEFFNSSRISTELINWDADAIGKIISDVNIIIDATTLGWKEKLFPGAEKISEEQWVFDLSYPSQPSPLLKLAEEKGCKRENGLRMLLYQAQYAHEIWFDKVKFDKNILPENRFITMD